VPRARQLGGAFLCWRSLESETAMLQWWAITIPHACDIAISRTREIATSGHHDAKVLQPRNIIDVQHDSTAISQHYNIAVSSHRDLAISWYWHCAISRCRRNRTAKWGRGRIDGSRYLKPGSFRMGLPSISSLKNSVPPLRLFREDHYRRFSAYLAAG
jgi:hypothetical protein